MHERPHWRYKVSVGDMSLIGRRRVVFRYVLLSTLILAGSQALTDQGASRPNVVIKRVDLIHSISVAITLFSSERDLFVPSCGKGEDGTESLCSLPAYLEVKTHQGWSSVKLRHTGAVLGYVPQPRWKVERIGAGERHNFTFEFRKEDFAVDRGQNLRVVVAAWTDEQSTKNDKPPIKLASAPFECP